MTVFTINEPSTWAPNSGPSIAPDTPARLTIGEVGKLMSPLTASRTPFRMAFRFNSSPVTPPVTVRPDPPSASFSISLPVSIPSKEASSTSVLSVSSPRKSSKFRPRSVIAMSRKPGRPMSVASRSSRLRVAAVPVSRSIVPATAKASASCPSSGSSPSSEIAMSSKPG